MSYYWNRLGQISPTEGQEAEKLIGKARANQPNDALASNLDEQVLYYLSEEVINYLADSMQLWKDDWFGKNGRYNDFSFLTAPAYKAFEGFLFQIAGDLKLPSAGNMQSAGTYFDEEKADKHIDRLIKEMEIKTEKEQRLKKQEREHIKDMVKDMRRFLRHYRHTPAHFQGEPIDTVAKAQQNVLSMYRIINETIKTLLSADLIQTGEELH